MSDKRYVVDNRKPSVFSKIGQAAVVVGSIATTVVVTTPAFGFLDLPGQNPQLAQSTGLPTATSASGSEGASGVHTDVASTSVDPTVAASASATPVNSRSFALNPVTLSAGNVTGGASGQLPGTTTTTPELVFEPVAGDTGSNTGNTTSPTNVSGGTGGTGGTGDNNTGNTTSPTSISGGGSGGGNNTGNNNTGNTTNPTQGGDDSSEGDDSYGEDDSSGEDSSGEDSWGDD